MDVAKYLNKNFPTVELRPSLFDQWDISIHFSLGKGIYQFKDHYILNLKRFKTVYMQTLALFNELFSPEDDLVLVTNIYCRKNRKNISSFQVYQPNLKDKKLLKHLQVKTYPYPFEADNRNLLEMQQFSLRCQVKDLLIERLLKATVHEDFPLKPRFKVDDIHYPDIFFVNMTRNIIFFVYDDRGCEVIAKTIDRLRPLYDKYYDWIEDVDRERIEIKLEL